MYIYIYIYTYIYTHIYNCQARENCGAMGWKLSAEQEAELDVLSLSFSQFPGMPLETA